MSSDVISSILKKGAGEMDLSLSAGMIDSFRVYNELLLSTNQYINLTAINSLEDIARLHFLDSLFLLKAVSFKNKKVLDVGSGAGFPGLPLRIVEPTIKLTLLDATKKRIDFLVDLCRELNLDVLCIHARAEDVCHGTEPHARAEDICHGTGPQNFREQFDIVVSRAVAQMNVLCELCLPYLRIGGFFPVMKGIDSDDEIKEALSAINILGAEVTDTIDYTIPDTGIRHRIILLRKISKTPGNYPRRFARIEKKPL